MSETLDLEISRFVAAPRAKLWQAWEDPAILAQWWCPKPWTTEVRAFDMRPGGAFHTFLSGPTPDGGVGESDNPGVFLEIIPQQKIVWTSMLLAGWRPATPWMPITATFTMDDEGAGTRYVARVMHAVAADRDKHVEMGFFDGWGACMTQIEEVAKGL